MIKFLHKTAVSLIQQQKNVGSYRVWRMDTSEYVWIYPEHLLELPADDNDNGS